MTMVAKEASTAASLRDRPFIIDQLEKRYDDKQPISANASPDSQVAMILDGIETEFTEK